MMLIQHSIYTPLIAPALYLHCVKIMFWGLLREYIYRVMLIQYTIYTPLIAPGAILLPCKNCVSLAIKGVIYRECDFNILASNAYFEV